MLLKHDRCSPLQRGWVCRCSCTQCPDPDLRQRYAHCGPHTERLARSTNNSAALLALLECGVFEQHPGLKVVVTALALNGLLIAGCLGGGARLLDGEPAATRRHVYIDTTGLDPLMIRTAVNLVGADHVVMGTDWPVVDGPGLRAQVQDALKHAGLDAARQQAITGGNALRLLNRAAARPGPLRPSAMPALALQ